MATWLFNKGETMPSNKYKIALWSSIALNAVLIIGIVVLTILTAVGTFDDQIVKKGLDTLCSEGYQHRFVDGDAAFNQSEEGQTILAYYDYSCGQGDASTFYQEGLDKYLESLGLPKSSDNS